VRIAKIGVHDRSGVSGRRSRRSVSDWN
jgi:hypothetical protein